MSTSAVEERAVQVPSDVKASLDGRLLVVKGKLGENRKDFQKINVNLSVLGNRIVVTPFSAKKKDNVVINTVLSIIQNMVTGVTKGFKYKVKVVYAHFPISVKTKGDEILVENFVGERSPRIAKIIGSCKVTVEGDDVVIKGVSLEDVGQTSANLEQATKIKRKDQRVFLDGLYIFEKSEGW
ncbi:MAG TPA: 50S ribosomal protein L6 [Nitrososphaerales archaeon]|nr:50S ribosomal protein L6 [Nitrososphaerales archaeon]